MENIPVIYTTNEKQAAQVIVAGKENMLFAEFIIEYTWELDEFYRPARLAKIPIMDYFGMKKLPGATIKEYFISTRIDGIHIRLYYTLPEVTDYLSFQEVNPEYDTLNPSQLKPL